MCSGSGSSGIEAIQPTRPAEATHLVRCVVLAAAGLGLAMAASALPFVQSTVYAQAGREAADNQYTVGPLAGVLTASNSYDDSGSSPAYGEWQASGNSNAGTLMYGLEPAVGSVQADAQVEVKNFLAKASATGGATLRYYFEIKPVDPLAHPELLELPVSFAASGHGEVSGAGRIIGSAALSVAGFPASRFSFSYEGSSDSRSFGDSVTLPLSVNVTGASYLVVLSATASAYNFAYPYGTAQSQAAVSVDPVIGFDQTAFDQQQGGQSFDLAGAYSIIYSAVPVPEPSNAALLTAGLIGLLGGVRRRLPVR